MPVYLKLGDIKGDAQDARYKGWIRLESVNFGSGLRMTNPGAGTSRGEREREPVFSSVGATITSGSISIALFGAAARGKSLGKAVIVFDDGRPGDPRGFEMENTLISSYNIGSTSAGQVPMDAFSLDGSNLRTLTGAELKALQEVPPAPAGRRR